MNFSGIADIMCGWDTLERLSFRLLWASLLLHSIYLFPEILPTHISLLHGKF